MDQSLIALHGPAGSVDPAARNIGIDKESPAETSPYPYQPLSPPFQTRILEIDPAEEYEDPLAGSIRHLELTDVPDPPYEALSYCWASSHVGPRPVPVTVFEFPDGHDDAPGHGHDGDGETPGKMHTIQVTGLVHNHPSFQQDRPCHMVCDGVVVSLGFELHSALKRLRNGEKTVRIWADALCINQANVEERNEQVHKMGEIYAKASRVHIWLGEEYGLEERAMQGFESAQEVFEEILDPDASWSPAWSVDLGRIQRAFVNHPKIEHLDREALVDFMTRAWFGRVWCIQEIANAREAIIHMGRLSIVWTWLSNIIVMMRENRVDFMLPPAGVQSISLMVGLNSLRSPVGAGVRTEYNLIDLLECTRDFKSTLACDKIYSMISMAKSDLGIPIDYSLDPAKVYKQVAVKSLRDSSDPFKILYYCSLSYDPPTMILPSWTPAWNRRVHGCSLHARGLKASASGTLRPEFRLDDDETTLHITGICVDKILKIDEIQVIPSPLYATSYVDARQPKVTGERGITGEHRDPEMEYTRVVERMKQNTRDWHANVLSITGFNDQTTPERRETLWRTLMCNRTRENAVPDASCGVGFDIWLESVAKAITEDGVVRAREALAREASVDGTIDHEAFAEQRRCSAVFGGAMGRWLYYRRFCLTEAGRYGWTMDGTQVGDEITVLYGVETPFVLRPVEGAKHTIVGDCYLHGMMDGEALNYGYAKQEFQIC